jgi:hypothetical protein
MPKPPAMVIQSQDIEISIEGLSQHPWGEDLHTNAAKLLVKEADITGWSKHNEEFDDTTLRRFSAHLLSSLCDVYCREHYLHENGINGIHPKEMTYFDVLEYVMQDLKANNESLLKRSVLRANHA